MANARATAGWGTEMRVANDNDLLAAARVNRSLAWLFAVGYGVLIGLLWYLCVQLRAGGWL